MALVWLKIIPLAPSALAAFDVQFNPNTYSIAKPVTWEVQRPRPGMPEESYRDLDAPPIEFGGGGARILSLQLFFDVTEGGIDADVRVKTNKIVALTRIEPGRNEPPVCLVAWGEKVPSGSDFPFRGVLTSLTQNFVLFRENGVPVRANLAVEFKEKINTEQNKRHTDPDLTTYLVKRGDTLSAIAAKLYRDPTLWRPIAAANEIDDPRQLRIGARLAIPKLT
jgi:hypothetical protein